MGTLSLNLTTVQVLRHMALENGTLVGQLEPKIDKRLGMLARRQERKN